MSGRLAQPLRQWILPAGLFAAITIALTYPLVRVAGSAFPHDAGDPSLNTWLLWWSTQRMPLTNAWWSAPMFYPMPDAMALSELLIGLLPITAPVQWLTGNPLLAYNTAFLLSFVLCGVAAYALALELTGRRDAALLAGLVFAFGPYRMNQLSHIQMLAYYWLPVSLLGLHHYVKGSATLSGLRSQSSHASFGQDRRSASAAEAAGSRPWWLAVFGGAWLMQALSNGYALFHFSVLIVLWLIWFVRDLRKVLPIVVVWALASLPLLPILLTYREVHEHLHLARDINEIQRFSADVAGLLSAPPALALWGGRLLPSQFETAFFPGLTVVALFLISSVLAFRRRVRERQALTRLRQISGVVALVLAIIAVSVLIVGPWEAGLLVTVGNFHKPFSLAVLMGLVWLAGSVWWRRAWRERSVPVFYVAAAIAMHVLSLGPAPTFLGRQILYEAPYGWLMRLPGFDVLRVPARFGMLALLCQAVLVALMFARWAPRLSPRRSIAAVLLGFGLLADGWIRLPVIAAPVFANATAGQAFARAAAGQASVWEGAPWRALGSAGVKAVIELPPGEPIVDFPALYRSMWHWQPLVNGFSGFAPPHYLPLVYAIAHGQFAALHELAASGLLGVAVDRSLHWHADMERLLSTLPKTKPLAIDDRWATFIVSGWPQLAVTLGPRLTPAAVRANRQEQDVARMSDGDIETAWGPGTPQDGGEEVVADFDSAQNVGAVVLSMGAYSFGFPRELAIDVSRDGREWETVWQSETSVATVRAALRDPGRVPLTFDLGGPTVRFLRLRQVGQDSTVPWWIAELEIHGPSQ